MARRPKLTPAVQARIVLALADGHYLEHAAASAGVGRSTAFRWLARGRRERTWRAGGEKARRSETRYLDFLDAVETAEHAPAELAVSEIRAALASPDARLRFQAACWFLTHRFPAQWGGVHSLAADPPAADDLEDLTGWTEAEAESLDAKIMAMAQEDPDGTAPGRA